MLVGAGVAQCCSFRGTFALPGLQIGHLRQPSRGIGVVLEPSEGAQGCFVRSEGYDRPLRTRDIRGLARLDRRQEGLYFFGLGRPRTHQAQLDLLRAGLRPAMKCEVFLQVRRLFAGHANKDLVALPGHAQA